jgi:hypothetical protein
MGSEEQVSGARFQVSGWGLGDGVRKTGVRCQVSGVRVGTRGWGQKNRCQVPGFRCQGTCVGVPPTPIPKLLEPDCELSTVDC